MDNSELNRLEGAFLKEINGADLFVVAREWKVERVELCYMLARVILVLKEHPDYDFEIVYSVGENKDYFHTSVPAFSSFELLENCATSKYYMAVGELLGHKALLSDLKKTMKLYLAKKVVIEKEKEN